MAYRSDLDALTHRHAALASEVSERTRELDAARRLLEEAQTRARLPVLDNIRVASPCTADWAQMTGNDRARACAQCNKNVYNISAMTRDEAEALIIEHEGELCVRYFRRADGTIMLKDCAIGAKRQRRRRWVVAGAAITFAGSLIGYKLLEHREREVTMGAIGMEARENPDLHVEIGKYQSAPPLPPPIQQPYPRVEDQWVQGSISSALEPPPIRDHTPTAQTK